MVALAVHAEACIVIRPADRAGNKGGIMNRKFLSAVGLAFVASSIGAAAAQAQDAPIAPPAECELHVWTSKAYDGMQTGLLVGFGAIGAIANIEANKGKIKDVKGQMAEYLDADAQAAALQHLDLATMLKKPSLRVVIEQGELSAEEAKTLKARLTRRTASTVPCYAELTVGRIFYHKAAMYGSNLFTYFIYRDFTDRKTPSYYSGQVKNPLENFPAKSLDKVDAARAEIRDAFAKDFVEYVQKKVVL